MKRGGIINAALAGELARLGHTHTVVIADAGLPLPADRATVDLAVRFGLPRFDDVLAAVLDEIVVEGATAAREIVEANPACWAQLQRRLQLVEPITLITHEALKAQLATARLIVRTGEDTPYSNVVLRCGVPF